MSLSLVLTTFLASAPAPLPLTAPATLLGEHTASVRWHEGAFLSARGAADERETNVLVYFWSNGSEQCANFYQQTVSEPVAIGAMNELVCFSAQLGDRAGDQLAERYGVRTLPTLLLVRPDGEVEDAVLGYIDPGGLVAELERMGRGEGTVTDLATRAAAAPADTKVAMALAIKYQDIGQSELYEAQLENICRMDSKAATVPGARAALYLAMAAAEPKGEDSVDGAEEPLIETRSVEKLLAKLKHDEVAVEGWNWVASTQIAQENNKAARKAWVALWQHVSEDQVLDLGNQIAWQLWLQREELTKKERKFALQLAQAAADVCNGIAAGGVGGDGGGDTGKSRAGKREDGAEGDAYEMSDEDRKVWRAGYLDTLACCQYMNGQRKEALETIELCLELVPDWEELAQHKQLFVSRG